MPRFLDPNAEELNSLLRPNARVNKLLKRQYKGTEQTIGQEGDLTEKYNHLYSSMIDIITSLGEIGNQLKLTASAPGGYGSKAIDRYISAVSAVSKSVANLLLYISQQVPSLQIFTTQQIESISGLNSQLVGDVQEIDQLSRNLPAATLERFRSVLTPIIRDITTLQQQLEGINTPGGRGSLSDSFKDGAIVAPRRPRRTAAEMRAIRAAATTAAAAGDTEGSGRRFEGRGGSRFEMRLPEAIGGAHTHRRFL
tara:strand:- start:5384 stop:6142 length:759 start_codon:yes stop_codon:yes gene_type:complete